MEKLIDRSPGAPPSRISPRRVRSLIRKEMLQVVRDPSSIAIALVMPVFLILLFGYALSLDVKEVPVAVVLEQITPDATDLAGGFELSEYFRMTAVTSMKEAVDLMRDRKVDGIIRLRGTFGRDLASGTAPVQVIVHGVDANRARIIQGYVLGVLASWTARGARERNSTSVLQAAALATPTESTGSAALDTRAGSFASTVPASSVRRVPSGPVISSALPGEPSLPQGSVQIRSRMWFNEAVDSHYFLVPGLVVLIMTLTGALLTALVMAREWERGTLEALFVTPVRAGEILLGKTAPYFLLGMGGLMLTAAAGRFLFHVPLRGSVMLLFAVSALYLVVALGIGLLISSATRSQFVASQLALIITFLPAVFLSGFIFDLASVPRAVQIVSYLLPARYYVSLLQTIFLAGNVWGIVIMESSVLAVMSILLFSITLRKTKKRLA